MIKAGFIGFIRGDDFWEQAKKAAAIGYRGMDGDASRAPGDEPLEVKAQKLRDIGIEPLTAAIFNPDRSVRTICDDEKIIRETFERAKRQNIKRITIFSGSAVSSFRGEPGTYDELMKDIDTLNKIVAMAAEEDLFVAYHNHYQEFADYHKGVHPIDYMLVLCDPRLTFELDTGWITVAGEDPVEVMRRLEGRIGAMHLKDIWDVEGSKHLAGYNPGEESCFTALGTGVLEYDRVLKEMDRQGLDMAILEQDRMRNLSPMESLQLAYLAMKETGLVE